MVVGDIGTGHDGGDGKCSINGDSDRAPGTIGGEGIDQRRDNDHERGEHGPLDQAVELAECCRV